VAAPRLPMPAPRHPQKETLAAAGQGPSSGQTNPSPRCAGFGGPVLGPGAKSSAVGTSPEWSRLPGAPALNSASLGKRGTAPRSRWGPRDKTRAPRSGRASRYPAEKTNRAPRGTAHGAKIHMARLTQGSRATKHKREGGPGALLRGKGRLAEREKKNRHNEVLGDFGGPPGAGAHVVPGLCEKMGGGAPCKNVGPGWDPAGGGPFWGLFCEGAVTKNLGGGDGRAPLWVVHRLPPFADHAEYQCS